WPARSLAPVVHSPSQTWSLALHAVAPLRSACAAGRQYPSGLSAALLPECCKPHFPAPTDPGTTNAPVHATAATAARATPARVAAPSRSRHHAGPLQPARPNRRPSDAQTTPATPTPRQTSLAPATSTASPATNARPAQRSCDLFQQVLPATTPATT